MTEVTEKMELDNKLSDILKSIEDMSVMELSTLVKALEEKFGVSAAVPMAAVGVGSPVAGAAVQAAVEEKSSFTVVLADVGANKINVIKEIRAVTTLGLKEAKDLVDSAPKTVKENVPKEEADNIKKKLEAAGAKVELK